MNKFLLCVLALALCVGLTAHAESVNNATITTLGTAKISVAPDQAQMTLGVRTEDVDVAIAQRKNAEIVAKVLIALENAGVTKDEMRTSYFNIEPVYDYSSSGSAKIRGYAINNTIAITTGNLDKIGQWLSDAIEAGANVGYGPEFSLRDSTPTFNEALALALKNARGRADALAVEENMTVGNALTIVQSGAQVEPMYKAYGNAYAGGVVMDAASTAQIIPGSITVEANVQVTFALR